MTSDPQCCDKQQFGIGLCPVHAPFEQGKLMERARIVAWLKRDDVNEKCWGDSDGPWTAREYGMAIEEGAHNA